MLFVHSALDEAGLSLAAFRVLAHLHRRADKRRRCYPSIAGMAEICRMRRTTAIEAVRELEEKGWIVAERSHGKKTVYKLGDGKRSVSATGIKGRLVADHDRSVSATGMKGLLHRSVSATTPVHLGYSKDIQCGNPKRISKARRPDLNAWTEFCASIGWTDVNAVGEAFDYWESVDWERKGGRAVKNWQAVARNAKRMAARRGTHSTRPGVGLAQGESAGADSGRIVDVGPAVEPPTDTGPDAEHVAWLEEMRKRREPEPGGFAGNLVAMAGGGELP